MTTRLTFPASMFSVVCQRCGSTVRKNADSCPTCGADRSAAFGSKRNAGAGQERPRGGMFEQTAAAPLASAGANMSAANDAAATGRSGWSAAWDPKRASERIAQKAAEHRQKRIERVAQSARNAYAQHHPDPDALPGSEDWTHRKTVIAGACALALLAGAVFYIQHGESADTAPPSVDHAVSGSIDSHVASSGSARSSVTQRAPAQTQSRALASGDPIQGIRQAMDQHDLTLAHARLRALSVQQQGRSEFEALKDELVRRELQRDAALQLARACERTSAWACVQQNAGEALSVDGSNTESQAMLERVIEHAGWVGTNPEAAKKALSAPEVTNATKSADAALPPLSPALNTLNPPSQANVAAVPPPAHLAPAQPPASTQKSAADKRAAQRSAAAARQAAADQARAQAAAQAAQAEADRADRLARAQAATNALTAATINTPKTPPATTIARPPAQATPPSAQAAAPRAPQYLGDSAGQSPLYQGPAQTQAAPRAPQYLDSTPQQPATSRAPHQPQYMAPSSSQAPVPHAPTANAAAPTVAQRVPPVIVQAPATQATAQRSTVPTVSGVAPTNIATAAPAATTAPLSPRSDADKTEALERAIKQYGWSGSSAMPKPAQ
jgi:hypothetical protein